MIVGGRVNLFPYFQDYLFGLGLAQSADDEIDIKTKSKTRSTKRFCEISRRMNRDAMVKVGTKKTKGTINCNI